MADLQAAVLQAFPSVVLPVVYPVVAFPAVLLEPDPLVVPADPSAARPVVHPAVAFPVVLPSAACPVAFPVVAFPVVHKASGQMAAVRKVPAEHDFSLIPCDLSCPDLRPEEQLQSEE